MRRIRYSLVVLALAAAGCNDDDVMTPSTPGTGTSSEGVVARGDIASDQAGATTMDPMLINAWGLAFNPAGPAWVSATESGTSAVYDASGNQLITPVTIPAAGDEEHGEPTGQVYNGSGSAFQGDLFIFVSEDGGISGWQPSNADLAVLRVNNSEAEANYKGVAIAQDGAGNARLYAADFHNGKVDVFDSTYAPLDTSGGFQDADLPSGFAPFNIEPMGGALIVTYALQDEEAEDDVRGAGNGYVDLYDTNGMLLTRLISEGELNSPWAVTMTPSSFGAAPNRLLVGNFGDGLVNIYRFDMSNPGHATATLEGALREPGGGNLSIDGLWALEFAPGNAGGFTTDQLYFTAGPEDETHGVFGRLETSTLAATGGSGGSTGGGGSPGNAGSGGTGSPIGY